MISASDVAGLVLAEAGRRGGADETIVVVTDRADVLGSRSGPLRRLLEIGRAHV